MQEDLIILIVIVLVPLIPAYILYTALPSETKLSGPFKGLNLQLTGAFAGYFLLVLTMLSFRPTHRDEVYTVIGTVRLDRQSENSNLKDTVLLREPSPMTQDGRFSFKIPLQFQPTDELEQPAISVQYPGFETITVHLTADDPHKVKWNDRLKKIQIEEPLLLRAINTPYSEVKAQTAQPKWGPSP